MAWIVEPFCTTTFVAAAPPMVTATADPKFDPEIVMAVPPNVLPSPGATLATRSSDGDGVVGEDPQPDTVAANAAVDTTSSDAATKRLRLATAGGFGGSVPCGFNDGRG